MNHIKLFLTVILLFVNFSAVAFGRDVTLYWEPSPSPNVIGYKVYYQQFTPQLPLRGTGATEGSSPIDVGNCLMATLTGLVDDVVYYFSVTAYDSNSNESTYSNIVSTSWMPPLIYPADQMTTVALPVTFSWGAGPSHEQLTYTLYYGTDKDQIIYAGIVTPRADIFSPPSLSARFFPTIFLAALIILMCCRLCWREQAGRGPTLVKTIAVAGLVVTLVACGGGGGGSGDSSGSAVSPTFMTIAAPTRVDTGSFTSHTANDLEPGTTYYWKVDATSHDNVYHSQVYSFTTQ